MKPLCLALFLVFGLGAPAEAYWRKGYLPTCDHGPVIAKIQQKFSYANNNTFAWGVGIEAVSDIRETPEIVHNSSLIGRRYCRGVAWLSDGRSSEVVYLIESKQGFASLGYRVQSCLPAFDPWHVYGSWCRSIKP
ncbi:MAG: hypothetical protein RLT05_02530 [Bauldia litoralis]